VPPTQSKVSGSIKIAAKKASRSAGAAGLKNGYALPDDRVTELIISAAT
jgi:hypothetical protein